MKTEPTPCPDCSNLQVSGTFTQRPCDENRKPYRVQLIFGGRTIIAGYYDTLEMARAGACGTGYTIAKLAEE